MYFTTLILATNYGNGSPDILKPNTIANNQGTSYGAYSLVDATKTEKGDEYLDSAEVDSVKAEKDAQTPEDDAYKSKSKPTPKLEPTKVNDENVNAQNPNGSPEADAASAAIPTMNPDVYTKSNPSTTVDDAINAAKDSVDPLVEEIIKLLHALVPESVTVPATSNENSEDCPEEAAVPEAVGATDDAYSKEYVDPAIGSVDSTDDSSDNPEDPAVDSEDAISEPADEYSGDTSPATAVDPINAPDTPYAAPISSVSEPDITVVDPEVDTISEPEATQDISDAIFNTDPVVSSANSVEPATANACSCPGTGFSPISSPDDISNLYGSGNSVSSSLLAILMLQV